MGNKVSKIAEGFITVAIVLVLVQTFLDDFSVAAKWDWDLRKILIVSGFFFDVLFTLEFLVRLFVALSRSRLKKYLLSEGGLIDFFASVPLVILNSGPTILAMLSGNVTIAGFGGMLNVFKVVKAVRVNRILRLLRVLKILRNLKNTASEMAQRHVGRILTITISTVVVVVMLLAGISSFFGSSLESTILDNYTKTAAALSASARQGADVRSEAARLAELQSGLLLVKQGGAVVYSRFTNDYYQRAFGAADYVYLHEGAFECFFDLREIHAEASALALVYFAIIIALVLMYVVVYTAHFAVTVTDPLFVMTKGFREDNYNLEVSIPKQYASDDIFQLAQLYNNKYLPLKEQRNREKGAGSALKLENLSDLLG